MTTASRPRQVFILQLFVTGASPRSARAISNIKRICDRHLPGRYELSVVDLYQQPGMAAGNDIVASPTLLKRLPEPVRRIVGDLSEEAKVIVSLDLTFDGARAGEAPDD
ncbi:MAG TPA: circadian clock KaiB family protein [Candidatus Polarisedimenticolia bacterium]|nr:circadian clock KaiB family protein [Candidatus Polarisedimenticolia bacterium]